MSTTGYTPNWNFGNGSVSNEQNPSKSYASAGNYRVSLKVNEPANGCWDSSAKQVMVYAKPNTLSITGPMNAPNGSTQSYSVSNSTGSSYQWWINNGTQTAGGTTNAISVQWSASATSGSVKARETTLEGCNGDTSSFNVSLASVGVNELSKINGLTIYPNPFQETITINSVANIRIALYDITGKLLFEAKKEGGLSQEINLSELSSGSYFIQVTDENNQIEVKQLMKINR
jgi:PKD repeat protein